MFRSFSFIFFLGVLFYSAWLFIVREQKTIRQSLAESKNKEPQIYAQNFILEKYKKSFKTSILNGGEGSFISPNLVEVKGGYLFESFEKGKLESLRSNSLLAYLEGSNFSQLTSKAEVQSVHLKKNVTFLSDSQKIETEYAFISPKLNLARGNKPVFIQNNWGNLYSGDGFEYYRETGNFFLYGGVKGDFEM